MVFEMIYTWYESLACIKFNCRWNCFFPIKFLFFILFLINLGCVKNIVFFFSEKFGFKMILNWKILRNWQLKMMEFLPIKIQNIQTLCGLFSKKTLQPSTNIFLCLQTVSEWKWKSRDVCGKEKTRILLVYYCGMQ